MESESAEPEIEQSATKSKRFRHIVWVTLMTGLLAVVVLVWTGRTNPSPRRTVAASPSPITPDNTISPDKDDPDASLKKLIMGSWKREYHGSWTMNVLKGGKGTLDIKLAGIWATIIGEKVHVILDWSVKDGIATIVSVSGKPETAFAAAKLAFGDRRIRKIKELTETRLVLLDEEDDTEVEWTRVTPASE